MIHFFFLNSLVYLLAVCFSLQHDEPCFLRITGLGLNGMEVPLCCRYLSKPMGIIQKIKSSSAKISSGLQTSTPPGKGAPTRHSRTSAGVSKVASRR